MTAAVVAVVMIDGGGGGLPSRERYDRGNVLGESVCTSA